jgi:hypothetical protein
LDAWLVLGAPPEFVSAIGSAEDRWRRLTELLDIDFEEIR